MAHQGDSSPLLANIRTLTRALWRWRAWLLRALIAWAVIVRLQPADPHAILGAPHTVDTQKPKLCVHTRLIDEVEEWKIQQSLQLVREMGANHIVEFFPWAYVEGQRGRYDWASVDRIMRHAENQGVRVIARMGFVPAWAQGNDPRATLNTISPEAYPDFAAFIAAFAARYAGIADEIIIWNEPNLAFEWGYQEVDPAAYVALLRAVYAPAHAANPNVKILLAGLAPTLEPLGSPNGLNDLLYLQAIYQHGGKPYFDAVSLHTYGFTLPAQDPPHPDVLNFRRAELLYDIMQQNDDAHKPVYITETGWNDHPQWALAVTPSQRAIETIQALRLTESWGWLQQACIWMLRTPAPINSHQDGYTMITPAFQRKAIYYAVQRYARGTQEDTPLWLPPPAAP